MISSSSASWTTSFTVSCSNSPRINLSSSSVQLARVRFKSTVHATDVYFTLGRSRGFGGTAYEGVRAASEAERAPSMDQTRRVRYGSHFLTFAHCWIGCRTTSMRASLAVRLCAFPRYAFFRRRLSRACRMWHWRASRWPNHGRSTCHGRSLLEEDPSSSRRHISKLLDVSRMVVTLIRWNRRLL